MGFREESRKVTSDCLIAYGGNCYSVPYLCTCQDVRLGVSKGTYFTALTKAGKPIARAYLESRWDRVVIDKEHYRGYIHRKDRESTFLEGQKLKERFSP